jgi:uncharacterized protein YejL (UPF0352 family)
VNIAENPLLKINTLDQHVAPDPVGALCLGLKVKSIKHIGKEDVYCLTVPSTGNFIANGMVVSNCNDAQRYVLFSEFFQGFGDSVTEKEADQMEKEYRFKY